MLPNGREIELDYEEFQTVRQDIASGQVSNDDINVTEATETDTKYVNSTFSGNRKYRDRLCEALPEEIGDINRSGRDFYVDGSNVATIRASIGRQRVLQHQQRRTEDNRYESDDYTWSVTINVSFGPAPLDDVNTLSETIVPEIVDALRKEAFIEKVRVAECRVEREGDCFV